MEFLKEQISKHVTKITAFNTEMMYLVQGADSAALIDSGSGFGNLRECVEGITSLPVVVLLTHGHTDHAMGAKEFDTVYMNHADDPVFAVHGENAFRMGSLGLCPVAEKVKALPYIETDDCKRFLPLKAGDVFDLGGVTIEMYACCGHTRGSMCMLIREERMLLLGDACNGLTFLFDEFSAGIKEYRESLLALQSATDGKYERVLMSHTGGKTNPDMVASNIAVCEDILSGNTDDQPFVFLGKQAKLAKAFSFETGRIDGGSGNIAYSEETKYR